VEKRELLSRLYNEPSQGGGNDPPLGGGSDPPKMLALMKESKSKKSSKRHVRKRSRDFWAQADVGGQAGWPSGPVPEPSRAWATFDTAASSGPTQSTSDDAASCQWAGWDMAYVPSSSSRTPPPVNSADTLLQNAFGAGGSLPVQHMGLRSRPSKPAEKRSHSAIPASAQRSTSATTNRSCNSETAAQCGWSSGSTAAGSSAANDFWLLAARTSASPGSGSVAGSSAGCTSGPWDDPFTHQVQWPNAARQASPGGRNAAWCNDSSGAGAVQEFTMPASPSPPQRPGVDSLPGSDATPTPSPLAMEPQAEAMGTALVSGATEAWPPAWPSDAQMPPLPCAAATSVRASASPSHGAPPATTSAPAWPARFDSDIIDPWPKTALSVVGRQRSHSETDDTVRLPDRSPLKPCRSRNGAWSAADHLRSPWDKATSLGDTVLQTSGVLVEVASGRRATEKQSLLA